MKKSIAIMASLIISPISFSMADSQTVEKLVQAYATEGVITADAAQGSVYGIKHLKPKAILLSAVALRVIQKTYRLQASTLKPIR